MGPVWLKVKTVAIQAIQNAITSPLLNDNDIKGAP